MESDTYLRNEITRLLQCLSIEASSHHEDLIENGLLDSLKLVELLVDLEQRFEMNIAVDELELDNFRSVARISLFVAKHRDLQAVSASAESNSIDPAVTSQA